MLSAALNAPLAEAPTSGYRRAFGASRDTGVGSSANLDTVDPSTAFVAPGKLTEMLRPIVGLIADMPFYAVMGASTQVIVVDIDSSLSVAFIAATESRVSSVLLWDSKKATFGGVLTITDYIRILLHCHDSNDDSGEFANTSIRELLSAEWLGGGRKKPTGASFVWGTPNLSVLDCLRAMRDNGINRLPILASKAFEEEVADVSSLPMGITPYAKDAASGAQREGGCAEPPANYSVVAVITLPQLLAHLGRVLLSMGPLGADAETAPLFDIPLHALKVGRNMTAIRDGTLPRVYQTHTIADVLRVMTEKSVNAVAILDENTMAVADVLTRSDVLRMESGGSYDVTLPLLQVLGWRPAQRAPVVCTPHDTFGDVLAHFVRTWVKEMFVVDPTTDEVIGQLSMKELMYFIIEYTS